MNYKKYFHLIILFYKMNLLSFWQYQLDFIAWILASFAEMFIGIINVKIIFMNVGSVNNWGFYEIMFITSFIYLVRCFWHTFMINILDISYYIRSGKLDYYLLKPISALFQLIASGRYNSEFDWEDFIGGLIILIISSINIGIQWNIQKTLLFILVVFGGTLIYSGIVLIGSTTAFWTVKSFAAVELLRSGEQLAVYPIDFYNKPIQYLLTYFIPFAFISYYPSMYFIYGTHFMYTMMTPIIGIGLWVLALLFWKYGLSKYQSTGN